MGTGVGKIKKKREENKLNVRGEKRSIFDFITR